MEPERLFLASSYYPPFGDDLRKVTFDVPQKTWHCLYRWRLKPSETLWNIHATYYPWVDRTCLIRQIRHAEMSHDAPWLYERLWLHPADAPPGDKQLNIAISGSALDYLIEIIAAHPYLRLSITIYRLTCKIAGIHFFREYEGHFMMDNLVDESG